MMPVSRSRRLVVAAGVAMLAAAAHAAGEGGWRRITPAEEQFVRAVAARIYEVLRAAASRLPGRWDLKLETEQLKSTELDQGQHHNRPHEVRVHLYAEWQPSEVERAVVDREIDRHAQEEARFDPVPDHVNRRNPAFKLALHAQVIVNPYGYQPVLLSAAGQLGEVTHVPGTAFSYLRWRQMGIEAPRRVLYLGELARRAGEGGERLFETFGATADCRNVRTLVIEVDSDEALSQAFVAGLDVPRLNALVREL